MINVVTYETWILFSSFTLGMLVTERSKVVALFFWPLKQGKKRG